MPTINCNGKVLSLEKPRIMAILNVTPDSFFDGGKWKNLDNAMRKTENMLDAGADIIDVGGMSSRPGAQIIEIEEEIERIKPVISKIRKEFPECIISVDTFRAEVAKIAIESGADMVNDISGGDLDPTLPELLSDKNIPYIIMHMRGIPENMQSNPSYDNLMGRLLRYFINKTIDYAKMGIKDLIIDPGFGFGKTLNDNFEILNKLSYFKLLERPILVGISRKSMVYKSLGKSPDSALAGTIAANVMAINNGASILRVHDVEECADAIEIWMKSGGMEKQ